MQFTLTFKTPDVLDLAFPFRDPEDHKEIKSFAEKFVEYGEYIYIDFDTEAGTATVRKL
jgi:hypothetical protein